MTASESCKVGPYTIARTERHVSVVGNGRTLVSQTFPSVSEAVGCYRNTVRTLYASVNAGTVRL